MLSFKFLDWTNTEHVVSDCLFWMNEIYDSSDRPTRGFMDNFEATLKRLEQHRKPEPTASLYILQTADVAPDGFLYHHISVHECGGKLSSPVAWFGEIEFTGGEIIDVDAFFGNLPRKVRGWKWNADGSPADVYVNEKTDPGSFYGLDAYQVSLIYRAWLK